MKLDQFLRHHPPFAIALGGLNGSDDDLFEARKYLSGRAKPLDCIPRDFPLRGGGAAGLVWVTRWQDAKQLIAASANPAHDIRMALGLVNMH